MGKIHDGLFLEMSSQPFDDGKSSLAPIADLPERGIGDSDLEFYRALFEDMVNGLFIDDDPCEVRFVRGERLLTFVVKPRDRSSCALVIGKGGSIIEGFQQVVRKYGELRRMQWDITVAQPE